MKNYKGDKCVGLILLGVSYIIEYINLIVK